MRRTRINPVSKKRQKQNKERDFIRKVLFRERGAYCEAIIPAVCSYVATDLHEILTRARGGSITDPENILLLCRECHRFITEEPEWAKENGFVVSWSVTLEADLQAAERARTAFTYGTKRG